MKITVIDSIEDLVTFEQVVNAGEKFEEEYVVLTRNLDFEDDNSYDGSVVIIGGTRYSLNGTVEETQDLKAYLCEGENGVGWTPIGNYGGNSSLVFLGTFDGKGYTISNLYINASSNFQGLFGYNKGTIKNISVTGIIKNTVIGAAGIAGWNEGTVERCINECEIYAAGVGNISYAAGIVGRNEGNGTENGRISKCINRGKIKGDLGQSGGICGISKGGKIEKCVNEAVVDINSYSVGGIVGLSGYTNTTNVLNCYNIGDISGTSNIGGIIGNNHTYGKVSNCYNIGIISGTGSSIGGIVGKANDGSSCTDSYYLIGTGTATYGIGSTSSDEGAEPRTSAYMKTSDFVTLLGTDNWRIVANKNNGYPILEWQEGNEVTISYDSLIIRSIEELVRFGQAVNEGNTFEGKTVILNRDLDFEDNNSYDGSAVTIKIDGTDYQYKLNGANDLKTYLCEGENGVGWTPIGNYQSDSENFNEIYFSGIFDGNNYTISNLYINETASWGQGLFGAITGTVKNLTVSGKINGVRHVGGIVGVNNGGTIDNCINKCEIYAKGSTGDNCSQTGGIVGFATGNGKVYNSINEGNIQYDGAQVGGICGYVANAYIENCSNEATINEKNTVRSVIGGIVGLNGFTSGTAGYIKKCYNIGNIGGLNSVGGIVGANYSTSKVELCYNTGTISGTKNIGGIAGITACSNSTAQILDCYNTGTISGTETIGGIAGTNGENNSTGTILNCYNMGEITGTSYNIGGIVGLNGYYNNATGEILDCYNEGIISGTKWIGGIAGCSGNNTGTGKILNCYNTGKAFSETSNAIAGIAGVNGFNDGNGLVSYCYNTAAISGTDTIGGIVGLNGYSNSATGEVSYCYNTGLISGTVWSGGIVGVNGHTNGIGKIENSYNEGTISATSSTIGGITGINGYNSSTGEVSNCYNNATVSGTSHIGGITGINGYTSAEGTISKCYNEGSVTGTGYNIGGIVGTNGHTSSTGEILNCYNTASISGVGSIGGISGCNGHTESTANIEYSYNVGTITGTESNIGGIIGYNGYNSATGTVSNSYYLDTTASLGIGSPTSTEGSKTEKDLKEVTTFANWDITIWNLVEEQYPSLIW